MKTACRRYFSRVNGTHQEEDREGDPASVVRGNDDGARLCKGGAPSSRVAFAGETPRGVHPRGLELAGVGEYRELGAHLVHFRGINVHD